MSVTRNDRLYTQQTKMHLEQMELLSRRNLELFNHTLDLREGIERIASFAGNQDSKEACRLICEEAKKLMLLNIR